MLKKILSILLTVLMMASISACRNTPQNDVEGRTEEAAKQTVAHTAADDAEQTGAPHSESIPEEEQPIYNSNNNDMTKDMPLAELREKLGFYVDKVSGDNLERLMTKDENRIKVEHEGYSSCIFHITTIQDGTEYKTTVFLSEGVRVPDIYCGFTSEQSGYVMIFHMQGYSISPMDDIELACTLKTNDGGKTWKLIEYPSPPTVNGRDYIHAACFFTEDVGFFTGRYCDDEQIWTRTYWTVDGGETWSPMPSFPLPDVFEPYGKKGMGYATEISDAELRDGGYLITVRICQGFSFTVDGGNGALYIQFYSTDLKDWTLVT